MTLKIEKNIPFPTRGKSKYPIKELEVGDSFLVDASQRPSITAMLCRIYRNDPDKRYTTRTVSAGKIRVWRVK